MQKEENLELIKKLAGTKVDTSRLRSSRSLGAKEPKSEPLRDATKGTKHDSADSLAERLKTGHDFDFETSESSTDECLDGNRRSASVDLSKPTLGSGLKRPSEAYIDDQPVIKKRRRLRKPKAVALTQGEPAWEGFSSAGDSDISARQSPSLTSSVSTQTESEADDESGSDAKVEDDSSSGFSESSSIGVEFDEDDRENRKERSSAFKAWASQQVNEALGFTPTSVPPSQKKPDSNWITRLDHKLRPAENDPLPPEFEVSSSLPGGKVFSVLVDRPSDVQEARVALPVVAEEQKIMEAILKYPVVVIWGATGSGKTTQVPQFLYEAGFGSKDSPNPGIIGVTQPRRVAAVSMSKRVGDELGGAGEKVSYQIRFDSSVSGKTAVKFMTDGILIREIANDFALLRYSIIVIDEAHERSANTDILIGMVSRIVDLRATMSKDDHSVRPLKLIIMSATLRVADFLNNTNLFRSGVPPLVKAEGRQYPVTTHFSWKTQRDYVEEAFVKVCKGHKKLPPGGMLVFLTGQNEITTLANRLKDALAKPQSSHVTGHPVHIAPSEAPLETEDMDVGNDPLYHDISEDTAADGDLEDDEFNIEESSTASAEVHILPLYSQLQTKEQLRVFERPPDNTRLIVLATNVAETSLTIPGIHYVFDTGRAKERKYDRVTGIQSFEVGWISKASASQRAGRAGRTGPGHCYRLYSSAVYERDFEEHAEPEILRMPVEGVVLQLKSMDLQHVVNFPFPTPPDRQSLAKAEKLLGYIGAISPEGRITDIGRRLSEYPLSPRFSKMLAIGSQHGCMPYTIALVAALATPNLFITEHLLGLDHAPQSEICTNEELQADNAREKAKSDYRHAQHQLSRFSRSSDALKALTALSAYHHAPSKADFCSQMFLSPKSLSEASNLQSQLSTLVSKNTPHLLSKSYSLKIPSPSKVQLSALQQITAAAFIDQIAILYSAHPLPPDLPRKPTRVIDVPYLPLFPIAAHRRAETDLIDVAVFIHPSSVMAHLPVKDLPTYIVYSHLQRSGPATIEAAKEPRTRMHALTAVTGNQIAGLAKGTPLLNYGKPIGKIEEMEGGRVRICWVVPNLVGEKGSIGWPLPAVKVSQRKGARAEWDLEKVVG